MTRLHPIPHNRSLRLLAPFTIAISLVILACGGASSEMRWGS